jgi:plasmid stability protein
MEAEIRAILIQAVSAPDPAENLFSTLLQRFGELGGVELEAPARRTPPRAADFSR